MKKRLSVTIDEDLLREIDSWRGSSPRSPLYEDLLSRALRKGLQLRGLLVEHESGSSKVYIQGDDDPKVFLHEVREEALKGQHVFDASRCGGCAGLKESFRGRP